MAQTAQLVWLTQLPWLAWLAQQAQVVFLVQMAWLHNLLDWHNWPSWPNLLDWPYWPDWPKWLAVLDFFESCFFFLSAVCKPIMTCNPGVASNKICLRIDLSDNLSLSWNSITPIMLMLSSEWSKALIIISTTLVTKVSMSRLTTGYEASNIFSRVKPIFTTQAFPHERICQLVPANERICGLTWKSNSADPILGTPTFCHDRNSESASNLLQWLMASATALCI